MLQQSHVWNESFKFVAHSIYTNVYSNFSPVYEKPWNAVSSKVAVLHFYITGFRGDWKALKQMFQFNREYSQNEAGIPLFYLSCFQLLSQSYS